MTRGSITADVAQHLSNQLQRQPLTVLHDLGEPTDAENDRLGQIVSWFGSEHTTVSELAYIDIAVVSPQTQRVFSLIEIEETAGHPKVVIGDALATLLGDAISFQGQPLEVGPWTTLLILVHSKQRPQHDAKRAYLQRQLKHIKSTLTTDNAAIGGVLVKGWRDQSELKTYVVQMVQDSAAGVQQ